MLCAAVHFFVSCQLGWHAYFALCSCPYILQQHFNSIFDLLDKDKNGTLSSESGPANNTLISSVPTLIVYASPCIILIRIHYRGGGVQTCDAFWIREDQECLPQEKSSGGGRSFSSYHPRLRCGHSGSCVHCSQCYERHQSVFFGCSNEQGRFSHALYRCPRHTLPALQYLWGYSPLCEYYR